jgi:RloB-like protein
MRSRQRRIVPQRRRVLVGCEGDSERGYAALLGELLDGIRADRYLDIVPLQPGAGDPLQLVERAIAYLAADARKRGRLSYMERAILLDRDRRTDNPDRGAQAETRARANKLRLIWQQPCFEALLLRHLPSCRERRPPMTALAIDELERHWPGYVKGLPAIRLAERIDAAAVRQAAAVEPELAAFLRTIGFLR